ncbi:MAG TPA: FCD domain-containing protein [Terracidiphilus sp.]|nr:FCD domain-containing protein [Terracidiphilus sp.]
MELEGRRQPASLTEQVVVRLRAAIERGALLPGAKLPTEAEIVRREGVSRTVVREAISRLQASGLVETRHGVGSFVRERARGEGLTLKRRAVNTAADILAVLEIRIAVEPEAAALAAARRSERNLRALAAAMAAYMKEIRVGRGGVDPDFEFHLEIARAARNAYFTDIFMALGPKAIPRSRFQIDEREAQRQEYLKRINNEHEDIYSAIVRGDAEAARAAVRNHLGNSRERMKRVQELAQNPGQGAGTR